VAIAIVDDGVDQQHEDLVNKLGNDGDGVEGEHGTLVAGVAGAETNNEDGVASLGWMITLNT
jgi:subtilisin family serine protease